MFFAPHWRTLLNILTSKIGLNVVCFVHVDFEMCFVPQRHALFQHLNLQKCLRMVCFVRFDFEICFAPQRRALFCHSLHNGVQFFISHLARWLRTRCFSQPTFRPSWATNHSKNTVFRDFSTFSRTWIFFLLKLSLFWSSSSLLLLFSFSSPLLFSSLTLPISAFHLSILSEVWLLNFLRLGNLGRDGIWLETRNLTWLSNPSDGHW